MCDIYIYMYEHMRTYNLHAIDDGVLLLCAICAE